MTKEAGAVDQIDQWKSTMFLYSSALKSINTKIEILNNEFIQLYNYNPIEHITSRLKTPASIVKKLQHDGREVTIENMVEYLNDIAGIRIICSFMSDIYPIADMIARYGGDDPGVSDGRKEGYQGGDPDPHHRHGFLGVPGA